MDRKFLDFLQSRSPRSRRVPLMVRGARQVGKSHTINQYGATSFEHLVEVNLELNPSYKNCFESLDPTRICRDLEVLCKKKLTDGKSLLFIDEIQDCVEAILSLRAGKEQRPGTTAFCPFRFTCARKYRASWMKRSIFSVKRALEKSGCEQIFRFVQLTRTLNG